MVRSRLYAAGRARASEVIDEGSRQPRLLSVAMVWIAIILLGGAGAELYARRKQNYLLLSWTLRTPSLYFFELDRLKAWNRRFTEQRREHFRNWPIPLELFDADTPEPRYLFKPNLRMTIRGAHLEPARPGDRVYHSTNSWGFRGPDFPHLKSPGKIRIVSLGASTTEGSQSDEETYPYYLQQVLRQMLPGHAIEVINAGHHGQGVDDLLEILRRRVLPLKPDVVTFYEASNNIGWSEFFSAPLPCALGSCWLRGHPWWYAWLRTHSALFMLVWRHSEWDARIPRPMPHALDLTLPKRTAMLYRDTLRKIGEETMRAGSRFVVVSFVTLAHESLSISYRDNPALFDAMYKQWYPLTTGEIERVFEYYNLMALSVARDLHAPFVDMATEFPRDPRYFPFDLIHFSPEGNKVFARILAEHLIREGIVNLRPF